MKYMVLIPASSPEYVEADRFEVNEHLVLELYVANKRTAAFVSWTGIKETAAPPITSVMTSTTTSNPTRVRIKSHFLSSRDPLVVGDGKAR